MKVIGNELQIKGIVASIDRDNIDTDQIIPTEYLKSIKKFGFEDYLFDGWRYLDVLSVQASLIYFTITVLKMVYCLSNYLKIKSKKYLKLRLVRCL